MLLEQKGLAELFGLSRTHTIRAVQSLRARGLLEWREGRVHLLRPTEPKAFSHRDLKYLETTHLGP